MTASGPFFAFLSSCTWAIGCVGYARLSRHHSAFAVNFARALFALPLFLIAVFVTSGGWQGGMEALSTLHLSHVGWFALSMFASYGVGDVLFLWSTRYLGVPGALALASSYPVWTALAGALFRGEHLAAYRYLGLVITVSGVLITILNPPRSGSSDAQEREKLAPERQPERQKELLKGVTLGLIASLLWATNGFAIAQGGRNISSTVGNVARMVLALIISAAAGRVFAWRAPGSGPRPHFCLPLRDMARWWWLFVAEAFFGSYFYMYGLSNSPLAIGATLSSLAPVISVPVSWVFGLERFSLIRTLGVCLVVMGVWLLLY